ncbi:hypothetical protein HBA54_23525 [Pelagibius litoralis]|uniref:Uncharacterized protein n=1 Tax=Pelagibius litoralis TaxID=374515 RepID=A0A967KHS6_9PROT|nr:hypothetical protein [Pelagibius litoralis]NIA71566.1 hypothetical protein [Pelagibius litoralis]
MKDDKTKEGAELWQKARDSWAPREGSDTQQPDALLLATYLEGRLGEAEAAGIEARMAADPAFLDEVLTLKAALTEAPQPAPASSVIGAQALRGGGAKSRTTVETTREGGDFISRLFGAWLRPAVPAFAVVALVLACAGAFELGRYQSERVLPQQTAGSDLTDLLALDELI